MGVGDCQQFGQQDYSMRIWVDPERLAALNLTAADVANALREQNRQVAAGHFGQQPTPAGQPFEFTITTLGRLSTPAEFDEIILRTDKDGRQIRIKDVGKTELGARNLDSTSKLDGMPNASLAIFALPDANAIATAERVRERAGRAEEELPGGHRLRSFPGHDAVHQGVDQRGHPHAGRGDRPGRHRRADLPAKLAFAL